MRVKKFFQIRKTLCASHSSTSAQESAVNAVSKDVAAVKVTDAQQTEKKEDVVRRVGAQVVL